MSESPVIEEVVVSSYTPPEGAGRVRVEIEVGGRVADRVTTPWS